MRTPVLFSATVLIWGTTWIAISAQVGGAPVMVSIFYRFASAGILMIAGLAILNRLRRPAAWRFVIIQAVCLFCLNFVGLYNAAASIPSGLVSVIFSLASIFNAVNARIFFGDRVSPRAVFAGVLGVAGLTLMFWTDLAVSLDGDVLRGVCWAVFGTVVFSLGNMASRKNTSLGVTPVTANAWGMGIGALAVLALMGATGERLVVPSGDLYWSAMAYLSVVGSVAGFTAYLVLVGRMGSAGAGYATVLFPIVALTASTILEGYNWTPTAALGVGLACLGNVVMFGNLKALKRVSRHCRDPREAEHRA
ncbi:membrane protein [Roseivivax halodurans JCM 10272]|uniref:Membrane protein n=1 Tax=Roseivivax halodurans JCM 10272 TaxID=1449350 RepID=X7EA26_9RHOB|nr:DMT family transporter [Roseivivax halodurans]ETX12725.1 membrane protein [Roseivivax halodurans JCM 10272]